MIDVFSPSWVTESLLRFLYNTLVVSRFHANNLKMPDPNHPCSVD